MGWQYMVALRIVTQKRNDLSTNVTKFTNETIETNGFRGEYDGHSQQSVLVGMGQRTHSSHASRQVT